MTEIAISTEHIVIPALGAGIKFNTERLKYLLKYVVKHLSICLTMLVETPMRNIVVLDRNRQESDNENNVGGEHPVDLRR
jgi:hypothetical protein